LTEQAVRAASPLNRQHMYGELSLGEMVFSIIDLFRLENQATYSGVYPIDRMGRERLRS
jgi:hypothetical protein